MNTKHRSLYLLLAVVTAVTLLVTGCVSAVAEEPITYWVELTSTVATYYQNLGDTPFGKGLIANTGIEVQFQHPASGQAKEQFSFIVADGDMPDIMEYNWVTSYPGGPEKAIKDGVIIALNDVIDQYCPNLKAYFEANPEVAKACRTDEGHYYCFPFIRGDEGLLNTIGLMIRKDWLDELNLEIPTTIDEWHTVLTAFKEQKGVAAPFTFEYTNAQYLGANPFVAAFNTNYSFYIGSDGTVHFGAAEEGYRQYLQTMHDWYAEGLIDPDIATMKNDQVAAKMTNGGAGASMGQSGSRLGTWTAAARKTNESYLLAPCPQPTVEKGAFAEFGYIEVPYSGRASAAITTSCKDVARAATLLDYAYGEAGHNYYNFGTEGVSYTMIDGVPTYTELIMNNPDGMPISNAMSSYIRGNYNGPFVQDVRYLVQYYTLPEQRDTLNAWGASTSNAAAHVMPPITPNSEESKEFATIMNQVNTHRDEMTLKFIFGDVSLDEFDSYVEDLKTMKLDRAIEIQNDALARYNNR